jgi:hypothetical protein
MKGNYFLNNKERVNNYYKNQFISGTFENTFPIHISTNLGISREIFTYKYLKQNYHSINENFCATLEVFVPSLSEFKKSLNRIRKTNWDNILINLGEKANNVNMPVNSRDLHGNVWDIEEFVMLSGKMTFVQFYPSRSDIEEMNTNNGSLYSINSRKRLIKEMNLRKKMQRNLKFNLSEMKSGDMFFSPGGVVHGMFDCENAHFIVTIYKGRNFNKLSKMLYGSESFKLKVIQDLNKNEDPSSYWGQYAKKIDRIP